MSKLKIILELIVFKHSIFALPFLLVSMLATMSENSLEFSQIWQKFVLAIICAVLARNYAMALNRLLDSKIDVLNERTKNRPSVDGRVGRKNLIIFIVLNAVFFVIFAGFINKICLFLSLPTLFLLGIYSLFKRFSALAHMILGLSLGFACIAGEIVLNASFSAYSLALCFGVACWTAGFDCLYALQDMDFDKTQKLHSIPSIYGKDATLFISALFQAAAAAFWLIFLLCVKAGIFAYFGWIIVCALMIFEQIIVRRNFAKIEKAFFDANAAVSLVFFVFFVVNLYV